MIDLWKRSDELLFISSSIEKTLMRALGEGATAEGVGDNLVDVSG